MKLKFLGTAAAEGIPAIFCNCKTCQLSRESGGKNIRKRSSLLLDNKIMFDFNDVLSFVHDHKLDLSQLEHIIITHSHNDHFGFFDLEYKLKWYTSSKNPPLNVYANEKALGRVYCTPEYENWGRMGRDELLKFHTVKRWQEFFIDDYKIIPLPAFHRTFYPGEETCIYVVEKKGKRFLYGLDSGWYTDETWEFLESNYFNCLILDSTNGFLKTESPANHMSLEENVNVAKRLHKSGSIDENSKIIATHYSHNGHVVYDRDHKTILGDGLIMSHDGMEIVL